MAANNEVKLKTVLEAENRTDQAFKELGKNVSSLQSSTGGLASGLKTLGVVGASLYVGGKLLNFFSEATKLAIEDERATIRLTAALENLGLVANQPVFGDFVTKMMKLGQAESDTRTGLTRLVQVTKNANEAIYLSKLASDLAASGMGEYSSNVEALASLYLGRYRSAAAQFGIDVKENASALEILNAIQGKVTIGMEEMANKSTETAARVGNATKEFMGRIGQLGLKALDAFLRPTVEGKSLMGQILGFNKQVNEESIETSEELGKASAAASIAAKQMAEEQKAAADKASDSFKDFAKNVASAFDQQTKAIGALRKSIKDLDDDLEASIGKSKEKYNEDVKNLARRAKERIDEIDKEIADEENRREIGFRTRVENLEKEKAKEQAILDKAGGIVTNIESEIAKDEFDVLRESHEKEIGEIQSQAAKKKKEIEDEIKNREGYLSGVQKNVSTPGFYEKYAGQAGTFLGSIGESQAQQEIVFNFNGDVSDIEALKKAVIEALNKMAALKSNAGQ